MSNNRRYQLSTASFTIGTIVSVEGLNQPFTVILKETNDVVRLNNIIFFLPFLHIISCIISNLVISLGRLSCHRRKHSQTISTIEILNEILVASTCMIDFICKSMAASNFCECRKSAQRLGSNCSTLLVQCIVNFSLVKQEQRGPGRKQRC